MILTPDFSPCLATDEKDKKDPGVISQRAKGSQEG